jgi:hypothetical protein
MKRGASEKVHGDNSSPDKKLKVEQYAQQFFPYLPHEQ